MGGLVVQQWRAAPTAEVRARLAKLAARGELVRFEATYAGERGLAVRVTVRPAPRPPAGPAGGRTLSARRRATRRVVGVLVAVIVAGLVTGLVIRLAMAALGWTVEWLNDHAEIIVGTLALLALALALLARLVLGGHGSGHCSGPNSGH